MRQRINPTLKLAMKPGVLYVVQRSTRCGTLEIGDRIRTDGERLDNITSHGWMDSGEWERFRCPVSIDVEYYESRAKAAQKQADDCRAVLGEVKL